MIDFVLEYAWMAVAAGTVALALVPWLPRVTRTAGALLPAVGAAWLLPVDAATLAALVFGGLAIWASWSAVREWTNFSIGARQFFDRIRLRIQIMRLVAIATTLMYTTVAGVVRRIVPMPADEQRAADRCEAAAKDRQSAAEARRAVVPALALSRLHLLLLASTAAVIVVLAAFGAFSAALAFCVAVPVAFTTAVLVLERERRAAALY